MTSIIHPLLICPSFSRHEAAEETLRQQYHAKQSFRISQGYMFLLMKHYPNFGTVLVITVTSVVSIVSMTSP